jgi:hypothetical protein
MITNKHHMMLQQLENFQIHHQLLQNIIDHRVKRFIEQKKRNNLLELVEIIQKSKFFRLPLHVLINMDHWLIMKMNQLFLNLLKVNFFY